MAIPERNPLLKIKSAAKLSPLYLLAGDDPFLTSDAMQRLKSLYLDEDSEWTVHSIESKEAFIDLSDSIRSTDLFARRRALQIKITHKMAKELKESLLDLAQNPAPLCLIVIEITDYYYSERNTLQLAWVKKDLQSLNAVINTSRLWDTPPPWKARATVVDSELGEWTANRARVRFGLRLGPQPLLALLTRCGSDTARLAGELEKLALYLHPEVEVTTDILDEVVPDLREAPMNKLTEAFLALDEKALLRELRHMETSGLLLGSSLLNRSEAQLPVILKLFQDLVRRIMIAQRHRLHHGEGEDLSGLAREMSLNPSRNKDRLKAQVGPYLTAARRVTPETLRRWQGQILDARRLSRSQAAPHAGDLLTQLICRLLEKKLVPSSS